MVCSGFAILISIFNMVMCAQNEFDPIILEKELLDRRQHAAKKQKRLDAIEQSSKDKNDAKNRRASMEDPTDKIGPLDTPVMDKSKANSLQKAGTQQWSEIELEGDKKGVKKQPSFLSKLRNQFAEQQQATGGVGDQINDYVKYYDNAKQSGATSEKNDDPYFDKGEPADEVAAESQRHLLASANRLSCDSPKIVE